MFEHAGITDEDQLFEEFHTILRSIPGEELESVFEAWQQPVQNVNQSDGGYIDSETISQYSAFTEGQHERLTHVLIHQTIFGVYSGRDSEEER
jgi:hypothetical protein